MPRRVVFRPAFWKVHRRDGAKQDSCVRLCPPGSRGCQTLSEGICLRDNDGCVTISIWRAYYSWSSGFAYMIRLSLFLAIDPKEKRGARLALVRRFARFPRTLEMKICRYQAGTLVPGPNLDLGWVPRRDWPAAREAHRPDEGGSSPGKSLLSEVATKLRGNIANGSRDKWRLLTALFLASWEKEMGGMCGEWRGATGARSQRRRCGDRSPVKSGPLKS